MSGPVSSGYPGAPIASVLAAFFAFLFGRTGWLAYKSRNGSEGRRDWRQYLFIALLALYLLAVTMWSIWKNHKMN